MQGFLHCDCKRQLTQIAAQGVYHCEPLIEGLSSAALSVIQLSLISYAVQLSVPEVASQCTGYLATHLRLRLYQVNVCVDDVEYVISNLVLRKMQDSVVFVDVLHCQEGCWIEEHVALAQYGRGASSGGPSARAWEEREVVQVR